MSSDKDAAGGFQFPACWSDDVRMGALFAQPRSENVNPQVTECFEGVGLLFCLFVFFWLLDFPRGYVDAQDWIGKYKFWRETIAAWAAHHDQLLVDVDQLKQAFWRKGKTPACLQRVLEEMAKSEILSGPFTSRRVEWPFSFLFVSFLFCVLVEDGGNCWRRASAKDWRTLRVGRPGASAWSRRRWPGPGTKSRARSSKSNDNCPVMS